MDLTVGSGDDDEDLPGVPQDTSGDTGVGGNLSQQLEKLTVKDR